MKPVNGRACNPDAYKPGHSETKSCTDCHLSKNNDNNAIMAQLLMQGTGYTNFMGRYCWVAAKEHGIHSVVVTEAEIALAGGDRQSAQTAVDRAVNTIKANPFALCGVEIARLGQKLAGLQPEQLDAEKIAG